MHYSDDVPFYISPFTNETMYISENCSQIPYSDSNCIEKVIYFCTDSMTQIHLFFEKTNTLLQQLHRFCYHPSNDTAK